MVWKDRLDSQVLTRNGIDSKGYIKQMQAKLSTFNQNSVALSKESQIPQERYCGINMGETIMKHDRQIDISASVAITLR